MTNDLINHPAFDFSKYHPGDQICIPMSEIAKMGQTSAILVAAAIANAATRAGLGWRSERREVDDSFVVSFFMEQ